MWITGSAGSYEFTTGDDAWKSRRLRADARVRVQVSSVRGRVAPGSNEYTGTGEILSGATDVTRAERALSAKYGWQFRATKVVDRVRSLFSRGAPQTVVAVRLRLTEATPSQGRSQGG